MYETMRVWENDDWLANEPAVVREDAGIWRDADKIVYSSTLDAVSTARTRVERQFDPQAVRQLKVTSTSDLSIGGATIGAEAFRHGLVDECVVLLCPGLVGGGKPALLAVSGPTSSFWTTGASATGWSTCAMRYDRRRDEVATPRTTASAQSVPGGGVRS